MRIQEAVAEIICLRGKDIFKDYKSFFALLDDLATEYPKERKIIKRSLDENFLLVFIDDSQKIEHRIKILQDHFEEFGLKEDYVDFILESFGIPLGWEQEILDLKSDSPMQVHNNQQIQNLVNANVIDTSLDEDVLKQFGFKDKNLIPTIINIPSTYKSFLATIYRIIKIDSEVFKDCDQLQVVTIPDTVTEIGDSAFENCSSLEKINIPDSVTKIGNRAFANCKSLVSIVIPNSVVDIGTTLFVGCVRLQKLTLPIKYTIFRDDVDEQTDLLSEAKQTTKLISSETNKLKSKQTTDYIEIKLDYEVLKKIGYEIKYGGNESGILTYIKKNGEDVTFLDIPDTYNWNGKNYKITQLDEFVFYRCASLTNVILPNSVTIIGKMAFAGCSALSSVTIPNSVTKIERSAFYGCSSLTSINIPDSVTEIYEFAFSNCSLLTNVIIPDSVTQIGYNAFLEVQHIEYHGIATGAPWGAKSMN
ncbi:leucine-rich repeat domain-containing protein [bacterium]|nr:leucine-rich repeat domain-containing protein [bacterium]